MSFTLFAVQLLNGLQFGLILFLVAAGLTLVFGVMDFVNLAHGVQYILGVYLTSVAMLKTGHFVLGLVCGLAGSLALGFLFEVILPRHLTRRDHLEQVLATFAVILIVTDVMKAIFGPAPIAFRLPQGLDTSIELIPGLSALAAGGDW